MSFFRSARRQILPRPAFRTNGARSSAQPPNGLGPREDTNLSALKGGEIPMFMVFVILVLNNAYRLGGLVFFLSP